MRFELKPSEEIGKRKIKEFETVKELYFALYFYKLSRKQEIRKLKRKC